MTSIKKILSTKYLFYAFTVCVSLSFVGLYLYNTIYISSELIRGDQWVWLRRIVRPLNAGKMSLFQALTFEYSPFGHSHIISLASFLFDYYFAGFNLHTDKVIGVASALLSIYLLWRYYKNRTTAYMAALVLALSSIYLLPSTHHAHFIWTLLQVYQYTIAISIWFIITMSNRVLENKPVYSYILPILFVSLLGGGVATAALVALPFTLILGRQIKPAKFFIILAIIIGIGLLLSLLITGQRTHTSTSFSEFAYFIVSNPSDFIVANLNIFSRSFMYTEPNKAFVRPLIIYCSGGLSCLIFLGTVSHYIFLAKDKTKYVLPVALILTGIIWAAGVEKTRLVEHGAAYMIAPRYAPFMQVAGLGACLYWGQIICDFHISEKSKLLLGSAVICLCIGANTLQIAHLTANAEYFRHAYLHQYEARSNYKNNKDLSTLTRHCPRKACATVFEDMEERNLNVFNGYPE